MSSLRGEPTHAAIFARMQEFLDRYDQPITRLISNALASGGYDTSQYANIFFMGLPDSELMRCFDEWEKTLRKVGEW